MGAETRESVTMERRRETTSGEADWEDEVEL